MLLMEEDTDSFPIPELRHFVTFPSLSRVQGADVIYVDSFEYCRIAYHTYEIINF